MLDMMQWSTVVLAATEEHGEKGAHHFKPSFEGMFLYVILLFAIIFGILTIAKQGTKERIFKNWFSQRFEQLYLFIENLCVGVIGAHGRQYVPIILGFWLVIFIGNLLSIFFPYSPTMDLGFNLALALSAFCYVQYEGMRANGVFGHLKHFAGPKLGLALIPITGMIFIIEIISELMKNLSLSLRLYGNIYGGHEATDALNKVGAHLIPLGGGSDLGIPFGAFLIPVKLLTCVVQALVFCLLTCVYLSLVTHHEHEEGDHSDHSHAPAHA